MRYGLRGFLDLLGAEKRALKPWNQRKLYGVLAVTASWSVRVYVAARETHGLVSEYSVLVVVVYVPPQHPSL